METYSSFRRNANILIIHILILMGICTLPFFLSDYYRMLAIESILLGVFAMSLDLIMGYAGITSFGHAAFFGAGGYALGIIIKYITPSILLAFLAAAVICGLISFIIGFISVRAKGIYFAILTLAFAEVIYRIVFYTYGVTGDINLGGSDGLIGIPTPNLDLIIFEVDLTKPFNFYYVAVAFAYLSFLVCYRITESPFGRVLRGIRENEDRISFLGFNLKYYKVVAFVLSGILAGWSGALFSLFKTFATTEQLHFLISGKVIVMSLIGGIGTLLGPMIGGIFLTIFETWVSHYFEAYHIFIGVIFITIVIFLPRGLLGLVLDLKKRR